MNNINPKFNVGDVVIYTNDQGVSFPDKVITKVGAIQDGYLYKFTPSDSPWVWFKESSLSVSKNTDNKNN